MENNKEIQDSCKSLQTCVKHSLIFLGSGYEFEENEILFNSCDEMARFVGFKDFKDLQNNVEYPKRFEVTINYA